MRSRGQRGGRVGVLACSFLVVAAGCGSSKPGGTVAGPLGVSNPVARFSADGGPEGFVFDGAGNLYTSDCFAARVFVIDQSGTMKLVGGSGPGGFSAGYEGDNAPASKAQLSCPDGVALDSEGNLFVSDHGNNRIRKISPKGVITTFAGAGATGVDQGAFAGDGGPASKARLSEPVGLVFDGKGNLYVADRDNHAIRKISPDGVISTVAGDGSPGFSGDGGPATKAKLDQPEAFAFDAQGNIYFSDSANNRVRRIDTHGVITTVAGTGESGFAGDGGPATKARIADPYGVAVDKTGNLYVSDTDSNRIRRIDTNGVITTIAGTGKAGSAGDGGPAAKAQLNGPYGLVLDRQGNLYVADNGNQRVRKIDTHGVITMYAGNRG